MNLTIEKAPIEKKAVLRNLLELYKYDFSEFDNKDVNELGLYDYKYLDEYWKEDGRYPFIIKVDDKIAGFAFVRNIGEKGDTIYFMSEFFVMKKYRGNGIGKRVAFEIFKMFQGSWVIAQIKNNIPAQSFWKKVISEYTNGIYEEEVNEDSDYVFQKFFTK